MRTHTFGSGLYRDSGSFSRQDLSHHPRRFHAGQLLFQALKRIVEFVVVEAKQIKHSRMQVADFDWILHDLVSHLVGLAMSDSGLDAAAGHPNRERAWVVVPANI